MLTLPAKRKRGKNVKRDKKDKKCSRALLEWYCQHASSRLLVGFECPSDDQFLSNFDHIDVPGGTMAHSPPVALVECADIMQQHHKVRRLHLVIVDLWRPWKINQAQVKSLTDQVRRLRPYPQADCTTPLAPESGKFHFTGRRFVYGYSRDGSDFPCYLLWPLRTQAGSFCLLESQTRRFVDIEHGIRPAALAAFHLQ